MINSLFSFVDNVLDIEKLTEEQTKILNEASLEYGMEGNDYDV